MGDDDDFIDWDERDENSEWCDRCQGSGEANCYCGGDQCYCENCGEIECPQCHGEGFWTPTPAQLEARAETARWWKSLHESFEATLSPLANHQPSAPLRAGKQEEE